MESFRLEKKDPYVDRIIKRCYPDYKGRKIVISTMIPNQLESYWDGGSRTFYTFYELATEKLLNIGSNHPFFEKDKPRLIEKLPRGIIIVAHTIFCGKDMGITIYANKEDIVPLLPEPQELTENEITVLLYTRSLKSSYAGIKNYRFYEAHNRTEITIEEWEKAKENCIRKRLLRKNGSITPKGRNAISGMYL